MHSLRFERAFIFIIGIYGFVIPFIRCFGNEVLALRIFRLSGYGVFIRLFIRIKIPFLRFGGAVIIAGGLLKHSPVFNFLIAELPVEAHFETRSFGVSNEAAVVLLNKLKSLRV